MLNFADPFDEATVRPNEPLRLASVLILLAAACSSEPGPSVGNNGGANNANNGNNGAGCTSAAECGAGMACVSGECREKACENGTKDDDETDVDCGGNCAPCDDGKACAENGDCSSYFCVSQVCEPRDDGPMRPECDDPGDAERFTRVEASGIAVDIAFEGVDGDQVGATITSGIALADFDGDGDLDAVVTNQGGAPGYFVNDGSGTFTDATADSGLAELTRTTSASVADIDGDGDRDLFLGRSHGSYLLINDGTGRFEDRSSAWNVPDETMVVSSASFADFDADGDLDLYVGSYVEKTTGNEFEPNMDPGTTPLANALLRNEGGTFSRFNRSPGQEPPGATLAVTWWDYDADGDLDLWVGNDFGPMFTPNELWRNDGATTANADGWQFTEVAAQAGFDVRIFSMSATVADFDNDLDLDAYVANFGNNVLHVMQDGTATDESVQRGVASGHLPDPWPQPRTPPAFNAFLDGMQEFLDDYTDPSLEQHTLTSWASIFFDADQDGWLDLWVNNGFVLTGLVPEAAYQPNYLFMNQGDGTFDLPPCWFKPDIRGASRGAAVGDIDGDGDLDVLFVDSGRDRAPDGVYVLRNDAATGNYLAVRLEGAGANTEAIGAVVTISIAGQRQMRHIDGGQGYMSTSQRVAHFGLGSASSVDAVEVRWPDGTTSQVDAVDANQVLVVSQP